MSVTHEIPQPAIDTGIQEQEGTVDVETNVQVGVPVQATTQSHPNQQAVINQPAQDIQTLSIPSVPSVAVPISQSAITQAAHGNPANSMTWLAHFWERVIKKALKKGWQIVFGAESRSSTEVMQNPPTQTSK